MCIAANVFFALNNTPGNLLSEQTTYFEKNVIMNRLLALVTKTKNIKYIKILDPVWKM